MFVHVWANTGEATMAPVDTPTWDPYVHITFNPYVAHMETLAGQMAVTAPSFIFCLKFGGNQHQGAWLWAAMTKQEQKEMKSM